MNINVSWCEQIKLFFDEKMKTISSLQMRMEFEHETKKIHFYVRGSTSPTEMSVRNHRVPRLRLVQFQLV